MENNECDYEACSECGFDHSYEPAESTLAHMQQITAYLEKVLTLEQYQGITGFDLAVDACSYFSLWLPDMSIPKWLIEETVRLVGE